MLNTSLFYRFRKTK